MNSAESRIKYWSFGLLGLWLGMVQVAAADLAVVQAQLRSGDYQGAKETAQAEASKPRNRSEEWPLLWVESLMMTGKYTEAHAVLTNALARHPRSIRLRWAGREVVRYNGHPELAQEYLNDIRTLVSGRQSNYTDPADFLIVGAVALLSGADPKDVLRRVYDPIQKADATLRNVYLARGELALSKHDFDLAAKAFASGLKQHPDDADFHYGIALAFADGDREQMGESLESALKHNSRHLPSLLLLADHKIDAEDYTSATKLLDEVSKVNPWHPDAWAYRAVLAHLKNDLPGETSARESGLRYWTNNPRVDHLIGKKLSQKYRFQEGASRQRSALVMDAAYLPAKSQLASDLLRLGNDPEGWRLAQQVHQTDGYDVSAFNLVTLHDTMARFVTLTNQYFEIRMHPREADIYGPRVLAFLTRARERLVAKYGLSIQDPTTVEIFSEQKDFGVRTFGIPDNPGYLGVCFGRVITANSPGATKGMPVNWEAVLWHEFCHVVTLQLTANRMPRWLSEGISVFEELEENKAWGQRMTPRYRDMILNGDLTPISKLSGAFLAPKTPFHLQFAYYESSLVVEFLVKRFGIEKLTAVLADLKAGIGINEAISRQTAPMDALEKEFATFAMARARALGPGLDWEKPKSDGPMSLGGPTLAKWAQNRPTNYWAMMQRAQQLVSAKQWTEAKEPLQKLVELYPDQTGKDSAYPVLAQVHRMLGETNDERRVLSRYADEDDEASEAYLRLAELGVAASDWEEVRRNSQRFLSVNPLVATPYRYLARAAEALGDVPVAIAANKTMLKLDPPNPSEVHYHLARLLKLTGDPEARQQVLLALEEAPRHRAALQLLLELQGASAKSGEAKP